MNTNIIMMSDSYKYSHWKQYPENMVSMFDYAEARSDKVYDKTVFFGLQYYIEKYLSTPITIRDIEEAQDFASGHGIPFNTEDWLYILNYHNGMLPVRIRAVKEGSVIPTKNVLFTVESTDPKVPWVAGFLETLLMKVWYTSNIATRSYYIKELISKYWKETVDENEQTGVLFSFHNFGDRGSSSVESAGIGGVAHLTQFMGTDNFNSLRYANKYYNEPSAGVSIPATEHSTTTAWGKENEYDMIMNHIETNKDVGLIAAVSDSYDYLKTVDVLTSGEFKEKIESDEYPVFVIRPDSGNPNEMVSKTLDIIEKNKVQFTMNSKGYKVLNKYRIIWGDGIDEDAIRGMLNLLKERGYAASNISFGSGGWLMQSHTRDSQGWAVKCSSITVKEGNKEIQRDVFKDPITDKKKVSKKGRVTTYKRPDGTYFVDTIGSIDSANENATDILETVYEDGIVMNKVSLSEVRANSL